MPIHNIRLCAARGSMGAFGNKDRFYRQTLKHLSEQTKPRKRDSGRVRFSGLSSFSHTALAYGDEENTRSPQNPNAPDSKPPANQKPGNPLQRVRPRICLRSPLQRTWLFGSRTALASGSEMDE